MFVVPVASDQKPSELHQILLLEGETRSALRDAFEISSERGRKYRVKRRSASDLTSRCVVGTGRPIGDHSRIMIRTTTISPYWVVRPGFSFFSASFLELPLRHVLSDNPTSSRQGYCPSSAMCLDDCPSHSKL